MSEESKDAARKVNAGGEEYTIAKFKGYKAFRIGRMLTSLGEIGPEISKKTNAFIVEYRSQNVDIIEQATLEFRYPAEAAGVSQEAWDRSQGVIKLANDPSQAEIMAIVFPTAFELAGEKVVELLAWVVASDSELERKDAEGEVAIAEYIDSLRKQLLFRSDVDELFDLAAAATDVLRDQLAGKAEQARSLLALVGLGQEDSETDEDPEEPLEEDQPTPATMTIEDEPSTDPEPKVEMPMTPASPTTSPRPDSSTGSPLPTDGDEETSSTVLAGAPLSSTSD